MTQLDILAFAPHPDDAEASCGGLLLKLSRLGYRVGICDLTAGELGSNGTPSERAAEAARASEVLEIHSRINLGLPDGNLQAQDAEQLKIVVESLRRHRPRLIIAPHEASRHPDHLMATLLVRRAQFFCGLVNYKTVSPEARRPTLIYSLDYKPMQPAFVVDITDVLANKMQALKCYRSQFEQRPEGVATVLNDPAYLQRIENNARTYGQYIHKPAGEPYQTDMTLDIEDPVAALTTVTDEVAP